MTTVPVICLVPLAQSKCRATVRSVRPWVLRFTMVVTLPLKSKFVAMV